MTFPETHILWCFFAFIFIEGMSKSNSANTAKQQTRMLKALEANHGNVSKAAKAAGISRKTHYNWYREDEGYAEEVNLLKHECQEEFKDLVREGIRKKVMEGNTTILALCYKTLFSEKTMLRMEINNPYKERITTRIKYVTREDVEQQREEKARASSFSPEGIRQYEEVLRKQREEKYGTDNPPGYS